MPICSKQLCLFGLMFSALLLGCGAADEFRPSRESAPASERGEAMLASKYAVNEQEALAENPAGAASGVVGPSGVVPATGRKIIYTATISLVVDDLAKLTTQIGQSVAKHNGYLADSDIDSTQGDYRTGRWQARVPTDQFQDFLESVSRLGMAESRRQSANDVTEEYVDIQARISAKKKLEERILELLASTAGKIQDVLVVEQELARVRGEIERMEGRMRFLQDQTTMTTVDISAREERDYVPPQSPTFANRIAGTWIYSTESVQVFFVALALLLVACTPWLVVLGIPCAIVFIAQRQFRRRRHLNDI